MLNTRSICILIAVLFLMSTASYGQYIDGFKGRLAMPDSLGSARVTVVEHADAAQIVHQMRQMRSGNDKIKGYRVRIFFDNSQNARSLASSTYARFKEFFPDVPAYMSYENPYFKVTVGNCVSTEEAIVLWGRVKGSFDRAFVVRETIQISTLGE